MRFDTCRHCQRYDNPETHHCPPLWEAAMDDKEPYWQKVYASSEEAAAELYADNYDCQGDYPIIGAGDGGDTKILVRKPSEETFRRYHVYGETVARYHANLVS